MSQAAATKLVSKLRFKVHDRRRLRNPDGPQGRHNKIKKTITALLKHERIELNYHRADESRGYAERLISEAIRNGDCHQPTMEMASYWIIEPQIVHKLFKVLAPRYQFSEQSYTKLWRAPNIYPGHGRPKCVLELRNNIYPPLEPDRSHHKNQIHNVLLEEAKNVYFKIKEKEALMKKAKEENLSITEKEALVEKAEEENLSITEKEALVEKAEEENLSITEIEAIVGKAEEENLTRKEIEALVKKAEEENLTMTEEEATSEIARKQFMRIKGKAALALKAKMLSAASQPEINENLKTESVNSEGVSELPSENDLKADSASKNENEIKIETNTSETDVDLSKLKIEDEKQKTPSDDEKR